PRAATSVPSLRLRRRFSKPPRFRRVHGQVSVEQHLARPLAVLRQQLQSIWEQLLAPCTNKRFGFVKGIWRRLPDLNRGWRFCRFPRVLYLVESSCSLVSGAPRF